MAIFVQYMRKLYSEINHYHNVRNEQKSTYESKF